jgi:hypothetical protein
MIIMLNKGQEQKAVDGSAAYQAGRDITITNGLSYSEVKQIALDIFNLNFYKLAEIAGNEARRRAEEITDKFLLKLQRENPSGFNKADDPDFQYALLTVQKEYARNGDQELGDLLINLLVDRSKQQQRDILQIVLNESLATAPKLTNDQLAALSTIFLLRYTETNGISTHQSLGNHFDMYLAPFASKLVKNTSCYQHLAYSGSGAMDFGSASLVAILCDRFQGHFQNGFDQEEILAREISIGNDPRFFMNCLNNSSKLQVNAINRKSLDNEFEKHSISSEDRLKIIDLFEIGKMNEVEMRDTCVSIRPYMSNLFETWSESLMGQFSLTSVGIAIGHANIKRLVGNFSDLSIWIN